MDKLDKEFVEDFLYPKIKEAVMKQLNRQSLSVALAKDGKGQDHICFSDGSKYLNIPMMTPLMQNVSAFIDIIALKKYLLS